MTDNAHHLAKGGKYMFIEGGNPVSLHQMLETKEARTRQYEALLKRHKDAVLISLKLNIPGPVKTSESLRVLFTHAENALKCQLSSHTLIYEDSISSPTGSEWLGMVQDNPRQIKALCCEFEGSAPWTRLLDIDVFYHHNTPDSQTKSHLKALSRTDLGLPERTCLLCSDSAFVCGRSKKHTLSELYASIDAILQKHFFNAIEEDGECQ